MHYNNITPTNNDNDKHYTYYAYVRRVLTCSANLSIANWIINVSYYAHRRWAYGVCLWEIFSFGKRVAIWNTYIYVVTVTIIINLWRAWAVDYSSWVCLCASFFHTVTNWPRRPTDRLSTASDWSKTCFFVKQPLRKATELASKLLAQLSAILFALTSARAYVDHVVL